MTPVIRLFALMLTSTFILGCGENLDPTDPQGAYHLFRDALFEGDAEMMWSLFSETTHEYFEEQRGRLQEMDEMIIRYLPQTDHRLARQQAGSVLLDEVADGKALFLHIFRPQDVPKDEKFRIGMNVDTILLSEDERSAELTTRGGQEFVMTRQDDGNWYVVLARSDALNNSMKWLEENQSALTQTVEDLIEAERRAREAIIAELMNLEDE